MTAIAVLASLTVYLAVIGIDWSDVTTSTVGRGIAAAVIFNLAIAAAAATWAAAT